MKRLKSLDFIKKSKEIHGEKYDYSLINDIEFVEQIDSFKRKRT